MGNDVSLVSKSGVPGGADTRSELAPTFPPLAWLPLSPHVGTGTAFICPRGGGWSHSWQSLRTLLRPGRQDINSQASMALETQPPGEGR